MFRTAIIVSMGFVLILGSGQAMNFSHPELSEDLICTAKLFYSRSNAIFEPGYCDSFKKREEYINTKKLKYLNNDQKLKDFLLDFLRYFNSKDLFETYFENVKDFIRNNQPLKQEDKEKIIICLLKAKYDENIIAPCRSGHQCSYTSSHIDILQDMLSLTGEGTSLMVIENDKFTKHPSIAWFAPCEEIMTDQDSHGGKVSSVVASTHQKVSGAAKGATIIPVIYSEPKSKKFEQMLQDKKDLQLIYEREMSDIDEKLRTAQLTREEERKKQLEEKNATLTSSEAREVSGNNLSQILLENIELTEIYEEMKQDKLKKFEQNLSHPLYLYSKTMKDINSNQDLKEYEHIKSKPISCLDKEYRNYTTALHYALLDVKTLMSPEITLPHVINMSVSNNLEILAHEELLKLQQLLVGNDIILVIAAGNQGGRYLSTKFEEIFRQYPNLQRHILFVGALDKLRDIAEFSNLPGPSCSKDFIFSPGTDINALSLVTEEGFKSVSGTSFAAPIVSATLSLLKKYFPTLSMPTLKEILLSTANPFPFYTKKEDAAITGCGQLDAFKAFLQAKERSTPKKDANDNANCMMM